MEKWLRASESLSKFDDVKLSKTNEDSFTEYIRALYRVLPSFQGDPFLESSFRERAADLDFKQALLMGGSSGAAPDFSFPKFPKAIVVHRQAIRKGYPAVNLYYHLAGIGVISHDWKQARWALKKATQAPLNLTQTRPYKGLIPPDLKNRRRRTAP